MASSRAEVVAEVLFELKRAGKVALYSHVARRAGFSAGSNGKVMDSCLKVVRRDWPHLHWWRAIKDSGLLEGEREQIAKLKEAGFEVEKNGDKCTVISLESHLMVWEEETVPPAAPEEPAEEEATTEE